MMNTRFDPTGSVEAFGRLAMELSAEARVEGLMVLACDANGWSPETLDPILRALPKPVFGGVFPQIIHASRNHKRGTLALALPARPEIACIPGLGDPNADYAAALTPFAERWGTRPGADATLVVLVDGLGKRIAALVEALFEVFGLEQNFLGGGAGSLSFRQKPCLITPEGLVADAALVARLPLASGVGVAHGWAPIGEAMQVTDTQRNVIRTLDWRPAFEVYRELVEPHAGRTFTTDNFFDIAKGYPFGITRLGGELVVRDPLQTEPGGGLVCVGEVPRGSHVRLLHGVPDDLIAAGALASARALAALPAGAPAGRTALCFDCISRVLFLGERIVEELDTAGGHAPLSGALTLGEIANSGREFLEFYNKTVVLGVLCHEE